VEEIIAENKSSGTERNLSKTISKHTKIIFQSNEDKEKIIKEGSLFYDHTEEEDKLFLNSRDRSILVCRHDGY
jgi:hypothetical protein